MNANEIEAVTAALAKVAETERTLRARVDELERQLVAYDAALDGDLALAEQVAPGTFFIKRKHAAAQLPAAVLRQAFSAEALPAPQAHRNSNPTMNGYAPWRWPRSGSRTRSPPTGGNSTM